MQLIKMIIMIIIIINILNIMIIVSDLAILVYFPNFCHVSVGTDFVFFDLDTLSLDGIKVIGTATD